MKKILLLGSGELGREFVISAKRLGCEVVACDSYRNAPAMQVADASRVFDMLDEKELRIAIDEEQPDIIVPEVESIRTEVLLEKEAEGYKVIPTARATNLTMNRDLIRDRANELGLRTALYAYAESLEELKNEVTPLGYPCVVKPVMSSSGKGQSVVKSESELEAAWNYAIEGMRGDRKRVIVEEFIDFDLEITILAVRQKDGNTVFCSPIAHHQERGDYQYSWQGHDIIIEECRQKAEEMSKIITDDLGGEGVFGVEFFIDTAGDVIFSELSPRPHDTGMVTMYTQNLSEFDLHARAILGLPIDYLRLERSGASHVVLGDRESTSFNVCGLEDALSIKNVDVRVFGKTVLRKNRRMAVALAEYVSDAKEAAGKINFVDSDRTLSSRPTEMGQYVKDAIQTESVIGDITLKDGRTISSRLLHGVSGCVTEAGELEDALKKCIFYGKELDLVNLAEEVGDVMWYLAILLDELGSSFEEVTTINIRKLKGRYPNKFSSERALNRNLDKERDILENKKDSPPAPPAKRVIEEDVKLLRKS
jgi:phosphoribosylglycinamide formyltransferase 2